MKLNKYSRPLDLLLASVESYRKGNTDLAGRFYVRAAKHSEIEATLNILDKMNGEAASLSTEMSKAIEKATAKLKVRAEEEEKKEDEKEESMDSELDLEESTDDKDEDDKEESDDGLDDDLDTILDGIDDEESTTETHEDQPTEDVKEGESADAGKDSPEGDDNLNDELPAPDKNEPAAVAAKAAKAKAEKAKAEKAKAEKAKAEKAKTDGKKSTKASDERTQSVARNLKILARLAATHKSKK